MKPHRRWNPLRQEWVLVSAHRTQRPWLGQVESAAKESRPAYDPDCYLCPGNKRASGESNPDYSGSYTFQNDFPALLSESQEKGGKIKNFIREEPERGDCRVVCFSERHDLTLAEMSIPEITSVLKEFGGQYDELSKIPYIGHVMCFENKGAVMGCSNPHPHGQIWANESIPTLAEKELKAQAGYFEENGAPLLMDYLDWELNREERLIDVNESWVSLVPHWAVWPFETMILPRRPAGRINDYSEKELLNWAAILKSLLVKYDKLFDTSFPYSMGIYQQPLREEAPGFVLNQKFFPPLLRSASIKKFMVGYELCAEAQRDLTAEQAAERLRAA